MQALPILPNKIQKLIEKMQLNEATEKTIFNNILKSIKNKSDKQIIINILTKEKEANKLFTKALNKEVKPKKIKIIWYKFLTRLFGYTFVLKIVKKKTLFLANITKN